MTQGTLPTNRLPRWQRWQAQVTLLQRLDTWLFSRINNLPHPPYFNNFMQLVAEIMNRGDGWLFGLFLVSYRDEAKGHYNNTRIMRRVAPILWLASATVEFPLKSLFRRQRPYSQVAQAVLVGVPPQRHSFPSGHAAAAFAGAWLLGQHYPRWRFLFYLWACVVAFCRIYMGAHYPSDVVAGGIIGVGLAAFYQRLLRRQGARSTSRSLAVKPAPSHTPVGLPGDRRLHRRSRTGLEHSRGLPPNRLSSESPMIPG